MRRHFPATTVIPDSAIFLIAALMVLLGLRALAAAEAPAGGWIPLFDGKTLMGWKASENPASFTIEDGCIVAHGPRAHLFSVGDVQGGDFKNFDLQAEVNAGKNSNSGIYFHTAYQEKDWPRQGFESQVNITHSDWIKTGSLYGVVNTGLAAAQDNKWWLQEIIVEGRQVTVKVDGKIVVQYTEPLGAQPNPDFTRKLGEGTFALQGHDPKSVIRYRNIRVKRPD